MRLFNINRIVWLMLLVFTFGCTAQLKHGSDEAKPLLPDHSIAPDLHYERDSGGGAKKRLLTGSSNDSGHNSKGDVKQDVVVASDVQEYPALDIEETHKQKGIHQPAYSSRNAQLNPVEFNLAEANVPFEMKFDIDDVLHFSVWRRPELTTDAKVQVNGMITLPLVGSIVAKGKSPSELSGEIVRMLSLRSNHKVVFNPNDRIRLFVWQNPDLSFVGNIRLDGNITFPLAGEVHAAGETVESLTRIVTQKMSEFLIHPRVSLLSESLHQASIPNPRVSIIPKQLRSRSVSVIGEVSSPGLKPIHGRIRLSDVLASANYKNTAELNSIVVIRGYKNTQPKFQVARMDDFLDGKDPYANIYLQADDIVVVPKSMIAKVGQFVDHFFSRTLPLFNWWIGLQQARYAADVGKSTILLNERLLLR